MTNRAGVRARVLSLSLAAVAAASSHHGSQPLLTGAPCFFGSVVDGRDWVRHSVTVRCASTAVTTTFAA